MNRAVSVRLKAYTMGKPLAGVGQLVAAVLSISLFYFTKNRWHHSIWVAFMQYRDPLIP